MRRGPTINIPVHQARLDAFQKGGGLNELHRIIKEAQRLAGSNASYADKAEGMIDLAEHICKTIIPYTPCTKGCSHCCYMAAAVSDYEADMIGRYLGRTKANAGVSIEQYADPKGGDGAAKVDEYTGVPCTLLDDNGKCSVYPVRPIACRTHHNIAYDETNCIIAGVEPGAGLPTTPAINIDEFLFHHAMVFVQGGAKYADIREWFPKKETNE